MIPLDGMERLPVDSITRNFNSIGLDSASPYQFHARHALSLTEVYGQPLRATSDVWCPSSLTIVVNGKRSSPLGTSL